MCEAADVLAPDIPFTRELLQCRDYGVARMCSLRWHLENDRSVFSDCNDIGERAINIDTDLSTPGRHYAHLPSLATQKFSARRPPQRNRE